MTLAPRGCQRRNGRERLRQVTTRSSSAGCQAARFSCAPVGTGVQAITDSDMGDPTHFPWLLRDPHPSSSTGEPSSCSGAAEKQTSSSKGSSALGSMQSSGMILRGGTCTWRTWAQRTARMSTPRELNGAPRLGCGRGRKFGSGGPMGSRATAFMQSLRRSAHGNVRAPASCQHEHFCGFLAVCVAAVAISRLISTREQAFLCFLAQQMLELIHRREPLSCCIIIQRG